MTVTIPQIVGILNVTPDSFSDGGQYPDLESAIARGVQLRDQGAQLVDVGGESTRPGAVRVDVEQEQARVLPVIRGLVSAGVPVSVDTMNADTALAAAISGASVINDVSGGLADPFMYRIVAETGLDYIAMHWRGRAGAVSDGAGDGADWTHGTDASELAEYDDVLADVRGELMERVSALEEAGVDLAKVIIDPGLGFAKNADHNWRILNGLHTFESLRCRVLIGASRKRFLGDLLDLSGTEAHDGSGGDGSAATIDRDLPSAVVSALAASAGVWGVRVHDVPATRAALRVWASWTDGAASRAGNAGATDGAGTGDER